MDGGTVIATFSPSDGTVIFDGLAGRGLADFPGLASVGSDAGPQHWMLGSVSASFTPPGYPTYVALGPADMVLLGVNDNGPNRVRNYGASGATIRGLAIQLDADGNLWMTGSVQGSVTLDETPMSALNKSPFVARYRTAPTDGGVPGIDWSTVLPVSGSGASGEGRGLLVAGTPAAPIVTVVGAFNGTLSVGRSLASAPGSQMNGFVVQLRPDLP
ncbi:MAG: hypothetical protein ACYC8T_34950 [Myxococcaceae bacterium]